MALSPAAVRSVSLFSVLFQADEPLLVLRSGQVNLGPGEGEAFAALEVIPGLLLHPARRARRSALRHAIRVLAHFEAGATRRAPTNSMRCNRDRAVAFILSKAGAAGRCQTASPTSPRSTPLPKYCPNQSSSLTLAKKDNEQISNRPW